MMHTYILSMQRDLLKKFAKLLYEDDNQQRDGKTLGLPRKVATRSGVNDFESLTEEARGGRPFFIVLFDNEREGSGVMGVARFCILCVSSVGEGGATIAANACSSKK
uniref:Uncharacterized protein n=1 Tax=Glossina pallidipes TaxID=7398 RepID=A0A1B0AIG5_GLOPL